MVQATMGIDQEDPTLRHAMLQVLNTMLDNGLPREISTQPAVAFVAPEGNALPDVALPAINLFLCKIWSLAEIGTT